MLKSVLMAPPSAMALACSSQIPTPLKPQLYGAPLNALLGNTLNAALTRAREFYEKCNCWKPSERAADGERRPVARSRRRAFSGGGIGIGDVAALHLGVNGAHDAFGHRMRRREHGEIDLQHGAEGIVMAPQRGQQFRRYLRQIVLRRLQIFQRNHIAA